MRSAMIWSGVNGAIAVALGAFAAHVMAGPEMDYARGLVEKGAHYQLIHAVALACVAALRFGMPDDRILKWLTTVFVIGILFFCGSLYAIAFTGIKAFGAVAPIGGTSFIIGWLMMAWAGWKMGTKRQA
jgi:uncharacterized membrane protein YgdD (TMEM256/DUF423 family)